MKREWPKCSDSGIEKREKNARKIQDLLIAKLKRVERVERT